MRRPRSTTLFFATVPAALAVWVRRNARRGHRQTWSPPGGHVVLDNDLAVRILGEGQPQVALLHGMFNSGRYWGGDYDVLARQGRLFAPDLLGFGRSPRPPTGYTIDAHADAVAGALRSVGVTEPIVFGAHSIGALVALRVAMRHPDLVAGIVAFSPPLYPDEATARERVAGSDPMARLFLSNEALSRRMCEWMCRHRDASILLMRILRPSVPLPLAEDRAEHSWASYAETLASVVIGSAASNWLSELTLPITIVAGTSDSVLELPFLSKLAQRHDNITLLTIEDAGHDLPLSHPKVCIDEIVHLLDATASPDAVNKRFAPARTDRI